MKAIDLKYERQQNQQDRCPDHDEDVQAQGNKNTQQCSQSEGTWLHSVDGS